MDSDTCIHSFVEWKKCIENDYTIIGIGTLIYDPRLETKKNFMIAPVALFEGKPICAVSRKAHSLDEAIDLMISDNFVPYVLYSMTVTKVGCDFNLLPIAGTESEPETFYIVRGALLS